jgi:hypothetical protein
MCMLQGVTMLQVEATPILVLLKVLSLKTDGVKHGATGCALCAIDDGGRMCLRCREGLAEAFLGMAGVLGRAKCPKPGCVQAAFAAVLAQDLASMA